MTVKTIVTWNPLPGIGHSDVLDRAADLAAAGKSAIKYPDSEEWPNGDGIPPAVITRSWVDEVAAQEWIDYLNSLPLPPESTQIVTE